MKNKMRCRQTSDYMVMASGILLLAGCSFLADEPKGGVPVDSTLEINQKVSLDRTGTWDRTAPSSRIPSHHTRRDRSHKAEPPVSLF